MDDSNSLLFSDTIGERESVRVSPEDLRERRLSEQINFVGMGNCAPIITGGQCTLGGIYDHFVINVLKVPLSG